MFFVLDEREYFGKRKIETLIMPYIYKTDDGKNTGGKYGHYGNVCAYQRFSLGRRC